MKKTILCMMIAMILISCAGCQKQEKRLTVCVDFIYADSAERLIDAWQHFNDDGTTVELVVIPQKPDEAEIKLTEIRTEIMSGGGPDIFILDTVHPQVVGEQAVLFDNVEKTMHSEIFLPLDEYLDNAQYMHKDAFEPVIFDSGKTDEGQLVLPIYYDYYLNAVAQNGDEAPLEQPSSWDDVVSQQDKYIQNLNPLFLYRFCDLLGKYTDYEALTLLYTEADLLSRVQEAIAYTNAQFELTDAESVFSGFPGDVLAYSVTDKAVKHSFYVTPSVSGGITAYVTKFAAINRNTKYPEAAFSILDMLFSDQVMCDEGFLDNEKHYASMLVGEHVGFGVPVHKNAFDKKFNLSEADARTLEDLNSQITAVNFYSDLDLDLSEMFIQCLYAEDAAKQKEIVNSIYAKMQMKLAE